jgi:NDP-sugar pyrophosphorylase family protein
MNGDVLFDDRMKGIVDVHSSSNAIGTIALREVEDITRFGVALLERDGGIKGFVEKPKPGVVASKWVNAGVYVFSKEIFKYIPSGKKVSTEREVFPVLAKEGKLHGFRYSGYWNDIGKVEDFINVNRRFMELLPKDGIEVDEGVTFEGNVHLKPPVKICNGSFIGSNAILGPYTVIGKGGKVDGGSTVSESILFNDCSIREKAKIDGSILADNVSIGVGATLMERVIVGTGVTVGDGVRIVGGVSICPYKEVVDDIVEPCHIV